MKDSFRTVKLSVYKYKENLSTRIWLSQKVQLKSEKVWYSRKNFYFKSQKAGASLVAQWLRICLPMQGTWVRALVWEDPTCRGATRPVSHNY